MKTEKQVQLLNKILADVHIIYVKLHNYHWNVKGLQFFPIHKITEEYYDYFFKLYDDIAERILQLDAKPLITVKDYLANARLKEESGTEFSAEEVLKAVLADFEALLASFQEALAAAKENDDTGSETMLGEVILWLEKAIWMLKSGLKK